MAFGSSLAQRDGNLNPRAITPWLSPPSAVSVSPRLRLSTVYLVDPDNPIRGTDLLVTEVGGTSHAA
eukprot:4122009-Prymnesium_polylepis.1